MNNPVLQESHPEKCAAAKCKQCDVQTGQCFCQKGYKLTEDNTCIGTPVWPVTWQLRWFVCGGGCFFHACVDLWRMFNSSFPACFFFFFKVEISLCTLIPLFRPGSVHSGSVRWDNCGWIFPDESHVSLFPDRFPLRLCWVKAVCVFRCNPPPALLAEWPGSFVCHCSNTGGWNGHWISVSTQS